MARPKNKAELLEAAEVEFQKLLDYISQVPENKRDSAKVTDSWSTKDIVAHLYEWHCMTKDWEEQGRDGSKPAIPAEGYTWKTLPDLNHKIYLQYKDAEFELMLGKLKKSHEDMIKLIESYSDKDLFTKKLKPWTGTTSIGAYFVSSTSSHYTWASDNLKKWLKHQH